MNKDLQYILYQSTQTKHLIYNVIQNLKQIQIQANYCEL